MVSPDQIGLDDLFDALRSEFVRTGELPAERELAERLNVKRHRLRRALERLREDGEIPPTQPGRRPIADSALDNALVRVTNPIEVIELRSVLEPAFARLATIRASSLDIARITQDRKSVV